MTVEATCAACGKIKKLTNSPVIDNEIQPRFCKDCVISFMRTGDSFYVEKYFEKQKGELLR